MFDKLVLEATSQNGIVPIGSGRFTGRILFRLGGKIVELIYLDSK
jgi:hypothetical protein